MRTFLHVAAGAFLCLIVGVGISGFWMMTHPYGAIMNEGFPLIQISDMPGNGANAQYELRQGEWKLFPYGHYKISIPDTKASFVLFKNNRGTCDIHSAGGILLVETNSNAHIVSGAP